MILDLLKRTTNGSIVLDLSKVPDQWVFDLLNEFSDSNQPTVVSPTVAEVKLPMVDGSKRNRQRPRPVKRARQRLRVVRKTLQKTVPESRSKLLY